ncbi:MAG: MarR family transcriptional regulator [Bradyrhizobium sp.]|nr:MarR family transcriptional regulator [Bradyrhizobium sp.]
MGLNAGKTQGNDSRREQRIRALGGALNALVSQARALTAQAAITFHAELQPAAFHIALWLNTFGPAKPSAVAEAVAMDRSAASRLTRELVRLKLVKTSTDPSDGRGVVLSLTADGRRRIDAAMQAKGATFRQRIASWNDEDLLLCTDLLRKLTDVSPNGRPDAGRPDEVE